MPYKKLNNTLKFLIGTVIVFGNTFFILQFLFIPGVIWNFGLYGFLVFSVVVFMFCKDYLRSKFFSYGLSLLILSCFADLTWSSIQNEKLVDENLTTEVKIMSYNLSFRNENLNSSCSIIKQANPDVLFVQELTSDWSKKIASSIGERYPFQEKVILERSRGIGIYSKFKIGKSTTLNKSNNKPFAQMVDLTIADKSIQLINVHLTSPQRALKEKENFFSMYSQNYQTRKAELAAINKYADEGMHKFECQFLVGDFNTVKYEPIFKKLQKYWVNTFDKVGFGFGLNFPNSKTIPPVITIDYIMAKGKTRCLKSEVLKGGDSDHLAIMTKMQI